MVEMYNNTQTSKSKYVCNSPKKKKLDKLAILNKYELFIENI